MQDQTIHAAVEDLIKAVGKSGQALEAWFDQNDQEVTPALGDQAHDVFTEAIHKGDVARAVDAAIAASFVYMRVGQWRKALRSRLDYHQVQFMVVDAAGAYQTIRDDTSSILAKALDAGFDDVAFQSAVLMADCAYFASRSVDEHSKRERFLLLAIEDLETAATHVSSQDKPVWMERFVSLLSATVDDALSWYWTDEPRALRDQGLQRLAERVEAVIPVDLRLSVVSMHEAQVAQALASLSFQFGTPGLGDARMAVVAQEAEHTGDLETWMQAMFARYAGQRDAESGSGTLAALRRLVRERTAEFRTHFRSRAGRLWASQELDRMAGEMLRHELMTGPTAEAALFDSVERLKTRTLLDQMQGGMQEFASEKEASAAAAMERELLRFAPEASDRQDELVWDEMILGSQLSIGSYWDRGERYALLSDIESFYATHDAGFAGCAEPAALDEIQSALQPDEAIIEYWIPFHSTHPALALWAMGITADRVVTAQVPLDAIVPSSGFIGSMIIDGRQPVDASPLGDAIVDLRTRIRRGEDAEAHPLLQGLYQLLIAPLAERGLDPASFRRWVVVPHGMLHHVPFGALMPSPDRFLIEEVALTVSPSATVWRALQRDRPPTTSFLGLANPDLSGYSSMPPLAAAESEVEHLATRLAPAVECTVFTGSDASEAALRTNVAGTGIVHLATHGEFPEADAIDFHNLLLSPLKGHDGRVHAEEIRRMDFSAVRLVVLSICNGGLYRFGPGDEPYGLLPALLASGAENVLGTLWPLEDAIGRFFMQDVYASILEESPAVALQQTCRSFIEDEALLRHWAGFVMVGPGRAIAG